MKTKIVNEIDKDTFEIFVSDLTNSVQSISGRIEGLEKYICLQKPALNRSESARYIDISISSFDKLRRQKNLPSTNVAGPRFLRSDLDLLIQGYSWDKSGSPQPVNTNQNRLR